ncbi:hypothetical protein [Fredinandcohnia sp. 179-A 10B2 NHS]
MNRGMTVLYREEIYEILHVYETGFCEIQNVETGKVSLVHKEDMEELDRK